MRRLDWPERLADYIERTQAIPFSWGTQDCVLWACSAIAEMTGADPAAAFRGTYSDLRGALRVVQALGGGEFRAAVAGVCEAHGFSEIPAPLAQRGDVVLCPSGRAAWPEALGICAGAVAFLAGDAGLVPLPMPRATAAWRVG